MFLGELKRWLRSPFIWLIALISLVANALATYGTIQPFLGTATSLEEQRHISETASSMLFGGALFTAIIGIIVVTVDIKTGYYRYLLLRHNRFWHTALMKTAVAAFLAVPVILLNLLCVYAIAKMVMEFGGMTYTVPAHLAKWTLRYTCLYIISAMWGVAVGLTLRSSIIAIAVQFIYATILEAQIISSFPKVGRWLFGGAESAIVDDVSLQNRLNSWLGLGIALVWVGLILLIAYANEWRRARSITTVRQFIRWPQKQ